MPRLTTTLTYNHNFELRYGCKSRTIYNIICLTQSFMLRKCFPELLVSFSVILWGKFTVTYFLFYFSQKVLNEHFWSRQSGLMKGLGWGKKIHNKLVIPNGQFSGPGYGKPWHKQELSRMVWTPHTQSIQSMQFLCSLFKKWKIVQITLWWINY